MSDNRTDIDINDPNFWQKWAKKADLDVDMMTNKVTEHSSAALLFPTSVTHSTASIFLLGSGYKTHLPYAVQRGYHIRKKRRQKCVVWNGQVVTGDSGKRENVVKSVVQSRRKIYFCSSGQNSNKEW